MISMGILKTLSQTRKQKGKYESISSVNRLRFMKSDDHIDFFVFKLFCWTSTPDTCHHYYKLCPRGKFHPVFNVLPKNQPPQANLN